MEKCESVKEKCESEQKNNSIFALKVLFIENNEEDKTQAYIPKDNSECEVLNKILIIAVFKCVVTFANTKFCSKE